MSQYLYFFISIEDKENTISPFIYLYKSK